jgi:hypothetical protein
MIDGILPSVIGCLIWGRSWPLALIGRALRGVALDKLQNGVQHILNKMWEKEVHQVTCHKTKHWVTKTIRNISEGWSVNYLYSWYWITCPKYIIKLNHPWCLWGSLIHSVVIMRTFTIRQDYIQCRPPLKPPRQVNSKLAGLQGLATALGQI